MRIYGIVQGVGFRPFVKCLADEWGLNGDVCNYGPFVEINVSGTEEAVSSFKTDLISRAPKRADIKKTETIEISEAVLNKGFYIKASESTDGLIFIPPDIAICDECKKELFDKDDRRYLHPFINCTQCGPRLSILENLPYDRERTAMREFAMCPECGREYSDQESRRFDAQPVCCNDCGPSVYLLDKNGKELCRDGAAITKVRKVIKNGGIAAIKGIGGFHLACDASSDDAVNELRNRKHRPSKPFAVMMKDMDTVLRECEVNDDLHKALLEGPEKPILLLDKKEGGIASDAIAPGNLSIGVMLPYAPLQLLLFDYPDDVEDFPDMLVMTSGNVSGAPICRDEAEAIEKLSGIADVFLSNDREIYTRADDSVTDCFEGHPLMIRRSRGYAPVPVKITADIPVDRCIAAIGGELKNTFCISRGDLFYPSSYVGDLSDIRSAEVLEETYRRFLHMLEAEPEIIVCDKHPQYVSVKIAEKLSEEAGIPLIKIQHHYAHVLSCMAENDHREPVIGISFDGTGYGDDGTIWGGEVFIADVHGYKRAGHISPFVQAGGDASSREGYRIACSMMQGKVSDRDALKLLGSCMDERSLKIERSMTENNINCVLSTSAGRLFDAVSAVLGIRYRSTFEGEAAMYLQTEALKYLKEHDHIEKQVYECENADIDTDGLFGYILNERLSGADVKKLAFDFHDMLAKRTAAAAAYAASSAGIDTAALSGGCFQNTLFMGLVKKELEKKNIKVITHSMIPPNDGGIALGQAYYGVFNSADRRNLI